MTDFEQVKKLRDYANITYEEAKAALEKANGDILEAVIQLEKENKIAKPEAAGYYNSQGEERSNRGNGYSSNQKENSHGPSFRQQVPAFLRWCGRIIHRGNINNFEVYKDQSRIIMFPVTVLVLLLIFAFWIIIPLLIIGLFFGYRYRFSGPDLDKPEVNETIEKVSKATVRAVDSVVNAVENMAKDGNKEKDETDGAYSDY
ncbi:MAG: ubiquitin [Firmicutes bacterium]|nr:ubiquitin [Bacillota bacterium]